MPPPSLPPERANLADFYAARRGLIPPLPWPTFSGAMRAIALGRKNYRFVGSASGGKAAVIAYTLIETAKLNGVDPQAWLADTLPRIPDYQITKVDVLLPWFTRP